MTGDLLPSPLNCFVFFIRSASKFSCLDLFCVGCDGNHLVMVELMCKVEGHVLLELIFTNLSLCLSVLPSVSLSACVCTCVFKQMRGSRDFCPDKSLIMCMCSRFI